MNTRPYELYISLTRLRSLWRPRTDWPDETTLRAALVALEFTVLLIEDALTGDRPLIKREQRVEMLSTNLLRQTRLLWRCLALDTVPEALLVAHDSERSNVFSLVDKGLSAALVTWVDTLHSISEKLPVGLGGQSFARVVRARAGLSNPRPIAAARHLDHDRLAQPEATRAIFEQRGFNSEDRVFATTHQICECWFTVIRERLDRARAAGEAENWTDAAREVLLAGDIMSHVNEHVLILETMVMKDYHRLRVRLRDASGAQSRQAMTIVGQARSLMAPLSRQLARQRLTLLELQRAPDEHAELYSFVEALDSLGIRVSAFFFQHYKLAVRVLGVESLGSLGYEVKGLVDRFVKPFFPDLDIARYGHGMITSFEEAEHAGVLVSQMERADLESGGEPEDSPPDDSPAPHPRGVCGRGAGLEAAVWTQTVTRYFAAVTQRVLQFPVVLIDAERL